MKTASSVAVACVVLPKTSDRKRSHTTWSTSPAAPERKKSRAARDGRAGGRAEAQTP